MMDPVQSWIDAKEVRRMAESLMTPPSQVDQAAVDAGYGDDFEGFAQIAPVEGADGQPQPGMVPQPDGRPHAQKQFINPSKVTRPTKDGPQETKSVATRPPGMDPGGVESGTHRVVAGSALADAKRVAEGSGMLQPESAPASAGKDPNVPVADASGKVSELPLTGSSTLQPAEIHNSPFQVSVNQQVHKGDPLARRVSSKDAQPVWEDLPEDEPSLPVADEVSKTGPDPAVKQASVNESKPQPKPEVVQAPAQQGAESSDRGPFLTRLKQFSALLRRELSAQAMFLIDNEGQVLLDEVENAKLIQVARTLANASFRASRQTAGAAAVGNLHVKIGASATLEVVPIDSRYGLLILGVIFPAPLGAERVQQVADLLSKTVEPTN